MRTVKTFYSAELRLAYEEVVPDEEGPALPIVMLHGMGCNRALMEGCMEPVFAQPERSGQDARGETGSHRGWQRLYVDLPGMGESNAPLARADTDSVVAALSSFVRSVVGDRPFAIAGQSYGGYLARALAATFADQVAGLLLLCPLVDPSSPQAAGGAPEPFRSIDQAYIETLPQDQRDSFMRNAVVADARTHQRFLKELAPGFAQANLPFVEALQGHLPYGPQLQELVGSTKLGCPALVVTGRQDRLVGYRCALGLLDGLTRATFAVLDTAGHNLQIERPEPFWALVQDWLGRIEEFVDGGRF